MSEVSSRNHQEFCSTEGGLFLGYAKKNNAKVAAALKRIFPAPAFRRAQCIELIQSGNLDGGILAACPGVFTIACGEKTTGATFDDRGVGGIWYAENGDIVLHAPRGRGRIIASSIDLIAEGAPEEEGNVSVKANSGFVTNSNNVKMDTSENVVIGGNHSVTLTSKAKVLVEAGEMQVDEASSASAIPGEGTQSAVRNVAVKAKLFADIVA